MKRSYLKPISLLLVVTMLIVMLSASAFASSVGKKDNFQNGSIKSQKTITADDPLIAKFKSNITIPDGNVDWNTAQLFEYQGASVQSLVFTTIDSKKQYGAFYYPEKGTFSNYCFEVSLSYDPDNINNTLNGTFGVYDKNGTVMNLATYKDGKISSVIKSDVTIQTDWSCFSDCMGGYFDQLPNWLQKLCQVSCPSCIFGNLTACSVCAGCLIGYGYYYCSNQCPG